ncbi:DUF1062 domain-containing protein [Anaerocolumna xylanovorans]|uniref:DUF1062 domain-containing protein n=1 Tax=Anaerocolumna xylanovorans DSM 12503 TaxID=1121345 RepID=A0A1M7Y7V3_9FIRM|nr:DUF1062 domain-containing protein [Anaerocolumna xylanovorans]SHO48661.1 hypothetical protein SAMN02745217_01948 [Anaerocolumna xylanovorans DSM 12503]
MSYYLIQPKESYRILKNCPKCKGKSYYKNSNNFRVNANGKQIDVWLIYQCETCNNTYNLSVYERVRASALQQREYEAFLRNDKDLAFYYGTKKSIFVENRVEIDISDIPYDIVRLEEIGREEKEEFVIKNPYGIKVRTDRVMAEIMKISRSAVKELFQKGILSSTQNYLLESTVVTVRKKAIDTRKQLPEEEFYAMVEISSESRG